MQRQFDPERVDQIRRARHIKNLDALGKELGLSRGPIGDWLRGKTTPTQEKLPALASALGEDIDELFPRLDENGNPVPPDLKGLRCDAGITMNEIPEIIGTATPVPVRKAENGRKRLDQVFAERLATRYGVSVQELRAAEDRTFGVSPAPASNEQPATPSSLAEKITHHLERLPADERPTDADIAAAINARAGRPLIAPDQALALRTGAMSQDEIFAQLPEPILHQALADLFNVPAVTFQSSGEMVDHLVQYVHALAEQGDFDLQARGGPGISPRFAAKLKELLAEAKAEGRGRRRGR
ncbi:helix-turn-helix domain-containing protein [Streptomyces lydicus]|uniref:helix-turn-helix domain-containing protein n=1 Tax=Streptomyces lydicus TaxID=47763 RepID=UPI0036F63FF2